MFDKFSLREKHRSDVHGGIQIFMCRDCGARFTTFEGIVWKNFLGRADLPRNQSFQIMIFFASNYEKPPFVIKFCIDAVPDRPRCVNLKQNETLPTNQNFLKLSIEAE